MLEYAISVLRRANTPSSSSKLKLKLDADDNTDNNSPSYSKGKFEGEGGSSPKAENKEFKQDTRDLTSDTEPMDINVGDD